MAKMQECDLVMKGGITSGIVYPSLVLKLKNKYRFRSIGGTSAGAIAAAATAAAEYGREQKGFEKLKDLQDQLSKGTFLRDLFQPSKTTRPLMNVLLDFISSKPQGQLSPSILQLILGLTASLWHHAPLISFVGALLGADLAYLLAFLLGGSVSGWRIIFLLLFGWLGALVVGVIYLGLILTRTVPENLLGICTGRRDDVEKEDLTVLTDWLNNWLNKLAGIETRKKPLTFGDLRCRAFGDERDNVSSKEREANITLRMVTSNLSQNLPYVLPFEDRLFIFREDDFKKLFPKSIVAHLVEKGLNYLQILDGRKKTAKLPEGYYFLPEADDLPVIVATRMSLSFPVLLSAVRLYTIKPNICTDISDSTEESFELKPEDLQVNWFSDGGICSNFPIHFFDAWLPKRPTFGVNLTSMPKEQIEENGQTKVKQDYIGCTSAAVQVKTPPNNNAIYLPKANAPLTTEFIPLENELIKNGSLPIPNLLRFIRAIFSTAQNYRDNAQSVLPSYRERIVQVRLKDNEGGLNLAMPQSTIGEVIEKGEKAGKVLLTFNFPHHQWVRFRVLMKLMEASICEMDEAIREHQIYADLVNKPQEFDFKNYPYPFAKGELLCQLATRLNRIGEQVNAWVPPELLAEEASPLPEPVLRVMPKV